MSVEIEEVTRCDKCGNEPDGYRTDTISCLQCGHHVCNNCGASLRNKHPEAIHPMEWCPKCETVVKGPYAR